MARNSYFDHYEMSWKRQHRFGIALTLFVYSICYLICDYIYIDHSSLEPTLNINNLYILSVTLICLGTFLQIIFDSVLNNHRTCIRVLVSLLLIIGGLLYITLTLLQASQRAHHLQRDHLLYNTILYASTALFICGNCLFLGLMNLMEVYSFKTVLLLHCLICMLTCFGMLYFWSVYYNKSAISPTQIQIGLIQTGWTMIVTVSSGTIIYEVRNMKHIPFLRALCVLFCMAGFLVFAASSAFNADIIFFSDTEQDNTFDLDHNVEILIEWSLSLCVFITCICLAAVIMNSTKDSKQSAAAFMHAFKSPSMSSKQRSLNTQVSAAVAGDDAFDIMLETEPRRYADV